jgi:hypothetical protein
LIRTLKQQTDMADDPVLPGKGREVELKFVKHKQF